MFVDIEKQDNTPTPIVQVIRGNEYTKLYIHGILVRTWYGIQGRTEADTLAQRLVAAMRR